MEKLIGTLKVVSDNIQILHRHLISKNWFSEHELLGNYYEMINNLIDEVSEIALSLDKQDCNISRAVEIYPNILIKDYTTSEAFSIVHKEFNDLIKLFQSYQDIPKFTISKFEEYENTLNLEANYKISRMIF